MSDKDPRIEDILTSLDIIKKKLPNGELESIKRSIESLSVDQKSIKEDLDYFKKRLFSPDDGVIVRINKNTEKIDNFEEEIHSIPTIKNKVESIESWQSGVNKVLWIIFSTIIGLIVTMFFATFTKGS